MKSVDLNVATDFKPNQTQPNQNKSNQNKLK